MPSNPTGTVTFLFSDIEGSTKLAREHPRIWEALRARHHEILREAIESNQGYVFQVVGDAFCAAFHTAGEAVRSAIRCQLKMNQEDWGDASLNVRMGIHTGKGELQDAGDYHGYLTLSRVQRLMSAAHGGQVLLSLASQELVCDDLPEGVALRDMGKRRLKDLVRPEHIYQLIIPDLPRDFPPLKTLDIYQHNLPAQMTSFIGREREIEAIKRALSEYRLVTLTGSGGTGKTRLSLQVAADLLDQFPDGVWFIELAPLTNPDLIPQTILYIFGVAEQQGQTTLQALIEHTREKKILLILDNCEHLIEASARVADTLLNSAQRLTILASSREALGVKGEMVWYVPSLALPDMKRLPTIDQLSQYEAVRLFTERAILVQPHLQMTHENAFGIAQICVQLDGIPLAIELAAARVKSLSVDQIAVRLHDRFRFLTGGSRTSLPRQQTLRAAIDWSYNLLSEPEHAALRRLSVFAGGWTLESAEAIAVGGEVDQTEVLDLLTSLVNKSLIIFNSEDERYGMLETARQYAREKLVASGEEGMYMQAHIEHFLQLAEEAESFQAGDEQVKWLNRLEVEHDNFRVALNFSLQEKKNDIAIRIAGALGQFWWVHSHLKEGPEWLKQVLSAEKDVNQADRAKALFWSGVLARHQGDYEAGKHFSNESLQLYRALGNKEGMAKSLNSLGSMEYFEKDFDLAQEHFAEALSVYRELGREDGIARALNNLGIAAHTQGNLAQAKELYQESIAICQRLGEKWIMSHALYNLGHITYDEGNASEARRIYEECLNLCQELEDKDGLAFVLSSLANVLHIEGQHVNSAQVQGAVLAYLRDLGSLLETIEQLFFDQTAIALKELLGEKNYQKEFEVGKTLALEQVIELARKNKSE
jgi:predicted ATPase/class 3 adenylate cyclase